MVKALIRKEIILSLTEEEAEALRQFIIDEVFSYYNDDRAKHVKQIELALERAGVEAK